MPRHSSKVADHFDSPRNAGEMEAPDAIGRSSVDGRPPHVNIFVRHDNQEISKVMFTTFGCGYLIAACSVLTELASGKEREACLHISATEILDALGGMPPEKEFCAQLAVDALHNAIAKLTP